ncbi:hypothetical protein EIP91_006875 [Steccherinum ochraceum]|uniref:Uncharacterized protein n=1 Tax=Steccherinum ochraceum TaxID=92696 RepID=A0A4V2MXD3_9APHY|nr:hypothetical protein EIP91_006875 [Steccherinum ochraceum]
MAFTPRHFVMPAAAFTMAVTVVFYTKYSITTARTESKYRRAGELAQAKEARLQSLARARQAEEEKR